MYLRSLNTTVNVQFAHQHPALAEFAGKCFMDKVSFMVTDGADWYLFYPKALIFVSKTEQRKYDDNDAMMYHFAFMFSLWINPSFEIINKINDRNNQPSRQRLPIISGKR